MTKSTADQYNELIAEFKNTVKRILIFKTDKTRKLPTEEYRILQYKTDLINSYNKFAEFISEVFDSQKEELQDDLHRDFNNSHKPKFLEALEYLGFGVQLPANFLPIDTDLVIKLGAQLPNVQPSSAQASSVQVSDTPASSSKLSDAASASTQADTEDSNTKRTASQSIKASETESTSKQVGTASGETKQIDRSVETLKSAAVSGQGDTNSAPDSENSDSETDLDPRYQTLSPRRDSQANDSGHSHENSSGENFDIDSDNDHNATMAQTVESFLKTAGPLLNYKYNGDPLKLNGFIRDAEMVQALASNDDTKAFAFKFIRSRLEGRADEFVSDECDTLAKLTAVLKEKIKPDSSAIIEGKMLALRLQRGDLSKFATETEKLGEAYRRSLIVEGITQAKAEELAIRKTIELCRKTAKADVVKSVLESNFALYKTPTDVVATFITQSDIARREYKEKEQKPKNQNSSNGKGNRSKQFNKNKNGGGNQNGNRSDNRGNNRGHQNQNQQQNRGRNNNGANRSNRNEHTIRVVTGAPPAPPAEQSQQQEQFFRLEN